MFMRRMRYQTFNNRFVDDLALAVASVFFCEINLLHGFVYPRLKYLTISADCIIILSTIKQEKVSMENTHLVSETVYQEIKKHIQYGDYLPGYHLTESELMKEYGVSRTTVRESLRRLLEDEIVEQTPNKGFTVRRLSKADMSEYYYVLEALEGAAASLAAKVRTPEQMDSMTHLLQEDRAAIDAGNLRQHRQIIFELRFYIADCAGNRHLSDLIKKVHVIISNCYVSLPTTVSMEASYAEHERLVKQIQAGNAELAASEVRKILRSAASIM